MRAVAGAYREAFSGLPRPVWLLAGVTFINRSGTMVLPFLSLYLTEKRGFTAAGTGQVLGVYGLGAMAGTALGGWLCDRLAPRKVMALSLLGQGTGFLILGLLRSRMGILGMVLGLSIVGEGFRPAGAAALVRASLPGDQARAFALNRLAINLGMTFGPAAGGFLASLSYLWLFVADGGTCLLAAAFLLSALRGEGPPPAGTQAATGANGDRSPWKDAGFLAFLPLVTLLGMVVFQLFSTFPLTLHRQYGFPEAWIGLVLAINTLVISLFEMILVHRLRDREPLRVASLGSFLFCAGFALLPLGSSVSFVAATVLVWTAGEMLSLPFISGWVGNRAGEKNIGAYMGLFTLAFSGAFVLGPPAGTWIYERYGPGVLWPACGAVGVLLGAGFALLSPQGGRARTGASLPQGEG